ncbi:MAG: 50S ribosomal protein L3, large subunit ribosomal protein L3 [candidate division Kazan bacterium GW2011_GWA1_50_15]|nr:MAG: 50S ribosomal protein L3, large subunit ribosomal protein L3 [candidate division Kazan bacterium GW2011_GWA1_50_15]
MFAQKLLMTQMIRPDGKAKAITILRAEPNVITQIKTADKDGYSAIQLGLPNAKPARGGKPRMRRIGEFTYPEGEYQAGQRVTADIFTVGDKVYVTATSKGRGFAGTVKRHKFHRGPMTHGHDHHRAPGSIGDMGMPRVAKGRRMSGHMGAVQVTVRNLEVVAVDPKNNLVAVTGAVPGTRQGLVAIRKHG